MHAGESSALLIGAFKFAKINRKLRSDLQTFLLKHGAGNSPNNNINFIINKSP